MNYYVSDLFRELTINVLLIPEIHYQTTIFFVN